jgi:hypothetical protein
MNSVFTVNIINHLANYSAEQIISAYHSLFSYSKCYGWQVNFKASLENKTKIEAWDTEFEFDALIKVVDLLAINNNKYLQQAGKTHLYINEILNEIEFNN